MLQLQLDINCKLKIYLSACGCMMCEILKTALSLMLSANRPSLFVLWKAVLYRVILQFLLPKSNLYCLTICVPNAYLLVNTPPKMCQQGTCVRHNIHTYT